MLKIAEIEFALAEGIRELLDQRLDLFLLTSSFEIVDVC